MNTTREEEMFEKRFEELELPTSRLVRRRRHLGRVYEQARKIASRKHDLLKKNLSVEVRAAVALMAKNSWLILNQRRRCLDTTDVYRMLD